ncbi:MAG: hypothetical protein WKF96_01660 [Solirubrobacteraceae bacterium]
MVIGRTFAVASATAERQQRRGIWAALGAHTTHGNSRSARIPSGVHDLRVDPPEDLVVVVKDGRVTGKTWGMLEPVLAQERTTGGKRYVSGWWIEGDDEHFAKVGDSGSIVCDEDGMVVGMAVAINQPLKNDPHLTFCHAIVPIHSALDVELP